MKDCGFCYGICFFFVFYRVEFCFQRVLVFLGIMDIQGCWKLFFLDECQVGYSIVQKVYRV